MLHLSSGGLGGKLMAGERPKVGIPMCYYIMLFTVLTKTEHLITTVLIMLPLAKGWYFVFYGRN